MIMMLVSVYWTKVVKSEVCTADQLASGQKGNAIFYNQTLFTTADVTYVEPIDKEDKNSDLFLLINHNSNRRGTVFRTSSDG